MRVSTFSFCIPSIDKNEACEVVLPTFPQPLPMGLKLQVPEGGEGRGLGQGSEHLVNLDEEAVDEVSGMLGVQGCFVDLDSGSNEVLNLLQHVIDAVVSSWKILHDS